MALNVPGVRAINEHRRYYPAAEVTAHLVGTTNIDETGQEGLELAYNDLLSGEAGQRRLLKDRKGRLARQAELVKSASPGKELKLSIDLRLQYMAYRELKKAVEKHKASAGSLVMLDVNTGEVLAMVNQPAYNPNNRSDMKAYKMRNRVLTDMVEPGSTLKPFAVAAALESGLFNRNSVIDTAPGYLRLGRDQVKDPSNYGAIDVTLCCVSPVMWGCRKWFWLLVRIKCWTFYSALALVKARVPAFPARIRATSRFGTVGAI